jgi:hypothetical protein
MLVKIDNSNRHFTWKLTCVHKLWSDWIGNPQPGNSLAICRGQKSDFSRSAWIVVLCLHFITWLFYGFAYGRKRRGLQNVMRSHHIWKIKQFCNSQAVLCLIKKTISKESDFFSFHSSEHKQLCCFSIICYFLSITTFLLAISIMQAKEMWYYWTEILMVFNWFITGTVSWSVIGWF